MDRNFESLLEPLHVEYVLCNSASSALIYKHRYAENIRNRSPQLLEIAITGKICVQISTIRTTQSCLKMYGHRTLISCHLTPQKETALGIVWARLTTKLSKNPENACNNKIKLKIRNMVAFSNLNNEQLQKIPRLLGGSR